MKRKFRKLSAFQHRIEDDLSKLDYLLGTKTNFHVRSSCSSGNRTKLRAGSEYYHLKKAVKITEANDANVKMLFRLYRKRLE
jgi:hypothetical protein